MFLNNCPYTRYGAFDTSFVEEEEEKEEEEEEATKSLRILRRAMSKLILSLSAVKPARLLFLFHLSLLVFMAGKG